MTVSTITRVAISIAFGISAFTALASPELTLDQAIKLAHKNDPWLQGSRLKQSAMESNGIAAGTLPDPRVSLGLMNMPVDSWEFNQEGMTQFKVGVSQMFARGDSLTLKRSQLKIEASKYPVLREERRAQVETLISQLWLDAFVARKNIELIEENWALFEQMVEVAKANYSTNVGKTRQQDVIRAQLEIVRLEDRLTVEQQRLETVLARMNEWLHAYNGENFEQDFYAEPSGIRLSTQLPKIRLQAPLTLEDWNVSRNELAKMIAKHPALLAIDIKHSVAKKGIELAKQGYKPKWGVNASYGYRDDMPGRGERADLFSVGVSVDIPLFTRNKQDKRVAASIAESESVKTEKLLLTKQMISSIEKEMRHLKRLSDRQAIYENQLLKQTHEQAEASLTAYTNDDGDFAEVVRARIAELDAKIAALQIDIDALKALARLNYFFAQSGASQAKPQKNQVGEY